jgi:integrase/recombinase XerD
MQHLAQEEFKSLIQNVSNPRHRLMLKVGFNHGLRVTELTSLTKENIRDGYVRTDRLKGSRGTIHPYVASEDPDLDEAEGLKILAGTLSNGERLFPMTRNGVYKMMQRAGELAGIPHHKLHPHVLKHSCAMRLIEALDIHEVQKYLGHKSLASTGEYLKPDEDAVGRKAARALAGK